MNNKQHFEFMQKLGVMKQSPEDRVMTLVNKLIDALYIVKEGDGLTQADWKRIKQFKIDGKEPINWGNVGCFEVKAFADGTFLVTIDEAAPKDCPTLCDYIQRFMKSWGWDVKVETEW